MLLRKEQIVRMEKEKYISSDESQNTEWRSITPNELTSTGKKRDNTKINNH